MQTYGIIHNIFMGLGGNSYQCDSYSTTLLRQIATLIPMWGCSVQRVSSLYLTEPVGGGRQPPFVNAVLKLRSTVPPARLLALAKAFERDAGRRRGRRNGPRPIDIDILDFAGRVIGDGQSARRAFLVLPHPELHRRRFVLQPLLEVEPHWHHPVLDASVRQLLAKLTDRPGSVQRIVDSGWISCDGERLREVVRLGVANFAWRSAVQRRAVVAATADLDER